MTDEILNKTDETATAPPTDSTSTSAMSSASNGSPQAEFETVRKQAEEYLNGWKRAQADFVNFKKDEAKRLTEFLRFANEAVILELIEVLDDLDAAAKEIKNDGLEQVRKKFQELLKKYDTERIKVVGEKFDPMVHEAVSTEPGGEKLEEVRAGYLMQDKVIRPARVKIIK